MAGSSRQRFAWRSSSRERGKGSPMYRLCQSSPFSLESSNELEALMISSSVGMSSLVTSTTPPLTWRCLASAPSFVGCRCKQP